MRSLLAIALASQFGLAALHGSSAGVPVVTAAPAETEAAPAAAPADDGSGPLTITTRLTPEGDKHVGDLLVLDVIVAHPQGYSVNLPMGLDFAPLELVSTEELGTEPTGESLRTSFRITLQYFELGEASIPPFRLTYVDTDGAVQAVEVPGKPFTISSLTANEADPQRRGEDPMVSLEYPNTVMEKAIYISLAAILVIALIVGAIILIARREKPIFVPPPKPAHEVALAALRRLEEERDDLIKAGEFQGYYLELTEIAKAYLQGRFDVDALDRTTDEIRRELLTAEKQGQSFEGLETRKVIRFLQECDLVKFARFSPPEDEACQALEDVRSMVRNTLPTREDEDAGKAAHEPEGATA